MPESCVTDVPAGAQLEHTLYGAPKDDIGLAYAPPGSQPAPAGGMPYVDDELIAAARVVRRNAALERAADKRCKGNDGQCKSWRLKDSDYCVFHDPVTQARSLATRRSTAAERPGDTS
jgi:hypothetical protein